MAVPLQCPSCHARLQVAEQLAGRKVKCPACATVFSSSSAEAPPLRPSAEEGFKDLPLARDLDVSRPRPVGDDFDDVPPPLRFRDEDDREMGPQPRAWDSADDNFRPRRRKKKKTHPAVVIGMVAGGGLLLVGIIVVIVWLVVAARNRLPGSTWVGNETLPGFGRLEFQFKSKDQCIMVDAQNTVQGTFTHSGNKVIITFVNAVYEGTINGQTMSGTARITKGMVPFDFRGVGVNQWTWTVTRK